MIPATITRRIIYHGRVQGVGFRATTELIAREFAVAGYVKNLPDGTVELVAQGTVDEVSRFLTAVAERFERCIEHADERPAPEGIAASGFTVRF